jgi:hypothetical protein
MNKEKKPIGPRGRPSGTPNKATTEFKDTVSALLRDNSDNVAIWLNTVAYGDGDSVKPDPKGALDLISKLAEYASPKLARTVHAGDQNQPVEHIYKWKD